MNGVSGAIFGVKGPDLTLERSKVSPPCGAPLAARHDTLPACIPCTPRHDGHGCALAQLLVGLGCVFALPFFLATSLGCVLIRLSPLSQPKFVAPLHCSSNLAGDVRSNNAEWSQFVHSLRNRGPSISQLFSCDQRTVIRREKEARCTHFETLSCLNVKETAPGN